jgi:hypothetical protein
MKERKRIRVTSRQVNAAANELLKRGGYSHIAKKYQELAVKGACENKGFVDLPDDDVIHGVIKSLKKKL